MKKLGKVIEVTLVVAGLMSVVPTFLAAQNVQQGAGRNMPVFENFDLNKDGFLTKSELDDARAKRVEEKKEDGRMLRNSAKHSEFSEIDLNGDGKVTKEEFTSHQMKKNR